MFTKQIRVIIYIILFSQIAVAQVNKSDSLLDLIKKSKGNEKLDLLFKISKKNINEEDGIKYAEDAIDVAEKLNDESLADSYDNLGYIYSFQGDDNNALSSFKKSLTISRKVNYTYGILRGLNRISQTYFYLDSLGNSRKISEELLKMAREKDSIRFEADALHQIGKIFKQNGESDSALVLMYESLRLREKIGRGDDIAFTYNGLGQLYYDMANYPKSFECYSKEITIRESLNDPYGLAVAYYNFGRTNTNVGNYQEALEQFQKALKTFEQINYEEGIAKSCNGIGMVYENLSQSDLATKDNEANYRKALEYYQRALDVNKKIANTAEAGLSLQNMGNTYSRLATNSFVEKYGEFWEDSLHKIPSKEILESFQKSIDYYNQSLDIFKETSDEIQIATVDINLGANYNYTRNWQKANKYLTEGLNLARKLNLTNLKVSALLSLGESNMMQGKYQEAEANFLESLKLSRDLGIKNEVKYSYEKLSKLYELVGDIPRALNYHKLAVKVKDEIFSEESQKAITEMQTKYETEKLSLKASLQESVIKKQKLTIIGAVIGAILILLVALLMAKMFHEKKKANKILEEKNELITEQKKEITDSIRYASRIQRAILPSDDLLNEALPEHFVLYLPRDIVSGDFFWLSKQAGKIVIVAADCTGHGVPGAFMSMLGVSFLYEIVNKEGILQPGSILNFLRERVKSTLSQTGKKDEAKDGMDISLCVLDRDQMKLEWAGAYNPLYIVRRGELMEYKADKMPIAIHMNDHLPFTNNEISVEKGDTFYISSDGYADQFGGEDGRKFMSKKYKEMLLRIWDKPMSEQKEIIHKAHLDWKGHHEQVDDILVFGVRI